MSCATSTIKYILFVFNFVFALAGILLVVIGILANSKASNFKELLAGNVSVASILIIGVGVFIFIVAFFGCCGAIQESHCMVITYTICLLTLFFVEIGIGIFAFVYRSQAQRYLTTTVDHLFEKYNNDEDAKKVVDAVQRQLRCCGVGGPSYWAGNVPSSCCVDDTSRYSTVSSCPNEMWTAGCAEKLTEIARDQLGNIGYIALIVAAIELVGVVFSLCLANSIKHAELRYA